jgi:hypothetical protein
LFANEESEELTAGKYDHKNENEDSRQEFTRVYS